MFELGKGILREITNKAFENTKDNMTSLDELINSKLQNGEDVAEILNPMQMFDAVANYLECSHAEANEGFKEFEAKLQRIVMTNPAFKQIMADDVHGYYEIGLALVGLGNRFITLENTEEEVVREKLESGTLTQDDAKTLVKANLRGLPRDLSEKVQEIFEGKETPKKVRVNDKNSMVELIKKGNITTPTMHILLQAKEITTEELRDTLDSVEFAKVMGEINDYARANGKDLIPYPSPKREVKAQAKEEHCHDCDKCGSKEICKGANDKLNSLKEEIAKEMEKKALDESNISDDEKLLRRALDKGILSDEDLLTAIQENRFNPFYLETKMKKEDPERYAKITVVILKRNAPDILARMGEDPIQTILDRITYEG
jgi:hypothetical protein